MLRALFLFICLPFCALSQGPGALSHTYVHDLSETLTEVQIQKLNARLSALEKETNVQLDLVLLQDLPPGSGLSDYARTAWNHGSQANRVVYVLVLNGNEQRLETGANLSNRIDDPTAEAILGDLKQLLQGKDYYTALSLLLIEAGNHFSETNDTPGATTGGSFTDTYLAEQADFKKKKAKFDGYMVYAGYFLLFGAAAFSVWAYRYGKRLRERRSINGIYMEPGTVYYSTSPVDNVETIDTTDFVIEPDENNKTPSGGGASGQW